jgi:hypothetical protein
MIIAQAAGLSADSVGQDLQISVFEKLIPVANTWLSILPSILTDDRNFLCLNGYK